MMHVYYNATKLAFDRIVVVPATPITHKVLKCDKIEGKSVTGEL
jgi:hypothetical protein